MGSSAPECHACRVTLQKLYRAVGSYGWANERKELVKADLCADHAAMLRQKTKGVIVLRSYRKRAPKRGKKG